MQKFSRIEKMWLLFFTFIMICLVIGCMYETIANHKPIGPRPIQKIKSESALLRIKRLADSFGNVL